MFTWTWVIFKPKRRIIKKQSKNSKRSLKYHLIEIQRITLSLSLWFSQASWIHLMLMLMLIQIWQ
jgi:hypothetical protein